MEMEIREIIFWFELGKEVLEEELKTLEKEE